MTLQSTGQITFSNITSEFGTPSNSNLGAFRVSESHGSLSNIPLDSNLDGTNPIPQTGEIKFSDFYGRRLNVVVDCHSGSTETRGNAKSKYNGNQVSVVGGFRSHPSPPTGIKVIINVNKSFKSEAGKAKNVVALRTGEYGSDCLLRVDVGSEGYIGGAGGNGGKGGNSGSNSGSGGEDGNSGLGIDHESSDGTTVINNSGTISAGFGGGGGGGGAFQSDSTGGKNSKTSNRHASGGGGGGGAGFPAGSGGKGALKGSDGSNGSDGTKSAAGGGGSGGNNDGEAKGGKGGDGGSGGEAPDAGQNATSGDKKGSGGSAGEDGAAIRIKSGITISVVNNGSIKGSQSATGVA